MKWPSIPLAVALLLWGFFAFVGFDALADITAQKAPGYPNAGQRNLYLYFPWGMTVVTLMLLVAVWWRPTLSRAIGCFSFIPLALLLPYVMIYGGGV